MISVENFYWVLSNNLLQPSNLDACYYTPFGTQQMLVEHYFAPHVVKAHQHVFFYFDQEPLYQNHFGDLYEKDQVHHDRKALRILANSEKSDLKAKICQDRGMLDWYYFYHGFAALDWFRDLEYISVDDMDFETVYLALNHLVRHKRSYRMSLMARLVQRELVRFGTISFHGTAKDCCQEIEDLDSPLTVDSKNLIDQYLLHSDLLPLIADTTEVDGSWSARLGSHEYRMWQKSFIHIVTETIFFESKQHLTEKIFKPIAARRPFILVGAAHNLAYLRSYGFQTFGQWIDESYDQFEDHDERLELVVYEIEKLCRKSPSELREIYQDMKSVLDHNKRHFFGQFRHIIVDELVENFHTCIRLWNNGRVDGRDLPSIIDVAQVKRLLSS